MDDARRNRLIRRVSAAAVAVPVVWALIAHVMGSVPTRMADAPPRPALAFTQHLVDLGRVTPSEEVFANFEFTNRSERMVSIRELVPSCGCLQPELKKRVYYPGESGHILLRVQTANQVAGAKEYDVAIHYEDPQPHEAKVVFRVELPENQVFIRPRALELTTIGATTPTVREIEITDKRPVPLAIDRVDCVRTRIIGISPVTTSVDEEGHTRFRFEVTIPGNLPEGSLETMIRVWTRDPSYRVLRVPLRIHTRSAGDFADRKPRVDPHLRPASGTVEETEAEVE